MQAAINTRSSIEETETQQPQPTMFNPNKFAAEQQSQQYSDDVQRQSLSGSSSPRQFHQQHSQWQEQQQQQQQQQQQHGHFGPISQGGHTDHLPQRANTPTQQDFDNALTDTNLTEFEMATANRPAHMTGAVSPKRTSLKLRSRSNSPNPRAMPYTDVKTQRRRTHSSSLAHTTSAAPAAIRPATRAGFRERCHTTPDRPASAGANSGQHAGFRPPNLPTPPRTSSNQQQNVVNANIDEDLTKLFNYALGSLASPQAQPPLRNRDLPDSFWNPSQKSVC